MPEGKDKGVIIQSVDRAVRVLECFHDAELLGITEISNKLGLYKSTTFGLVNTLTSHRLLEQDPATGKYRLGIEMFRLGSKTRINIREICLPHIRQLVDVLGETVNLVIQDGKKVVYIEKQESPHSMRICTQIGQRSPFYCTAVGKVMLAFMDPQEAQRLMEETPLEALTEHTITSQEALAQEVALTRSRGYGIDAEEFEYGLYCVAVPILGPSGTAVAALSCSGPRQRMTEETVQNIYVQLLRHAREIAASLY